MATEYTTQIPASVNSATPVAKASGNTKRQALPAQVTPATGAINQGQAQSDSSPARDTSNPSQQVERGRLDQAVSRLQEYVQSIDREFDFSVDEDSGRTVVKVVDGQTQEVIRQIPPETALRLAEHFQELKGMLIQEEA